MTLHRLRSILFGFVAFTILLAACNLPGWEEKTLPEGAYPVDPLFQAPYERLGGGDVLGHAISPVFEHERRFYQYTVSALLLYDPQAESGQEFMLAPLGRDLGIFEFPTEKNQTGPQVVAGYRVDDRFFPLFERLGGEAVVGAPLTEAHLNAEKNRYEQYFENLGFTWQVDDDPEAVSLLAYGAWKCDHYCRHTPPQNAAVSLPTRNSEVFIRKVAGLGLDFTGFALTPPYFAADGRLEQVYENVVLAASAAKPDEVYLLDLPEKIGIQRDLLMPPDAREGFFFYPVQGQSGYNVPDFFMEYIKAHGGFDLVGPPLTQAIEMEGSLYRQCFATLCLQRQPDGSGGAVVRPVAIGLKYRALFYRPDAAAVTGAEATDVTVQIWEGYPMVSPGQEQEIGVAVFGGGTPLERVLPILQLTAPDGEKQIFTLPPTDKNGESSLMIPGLQAANGTLVPYKVCVSVPNGQRFCIMDSYLIWKADYLTVTPSLAPGNTAYFPFVLRNMTVYIPAVIESYKTYLPFLNATR